MESTPDDYELAFKVAVEESDRLAAEKKKQEAQLRKDEEYAKKLNKESVSFTEAVNKVNDKVINSKKLFENYGLTVKNIIWESYHNGSATEITLHLHKQTTNLPVIRPIKSDIIDIKLDQIPITLGNEVDNTGNIRYNISLLEFLRNMRNYVPCWVKDDTLLTFGESTASFASQLCFFPENSSSYNVAVCHYGNHPLLTIIATDRGTSVHYVLPNYNSPQYLNFNLNGRNNSFSKEKKVLIIQVPLVSRKVFHAPTVKMSSPPAIEGKFPELGKEIIERAQGNPIRVTLQMYKSLEDRILDESKMMQVFEMFADAKSKALL